MNMASTVAAGAAAGALELEDDEFQTAQDLHQWLVQERKVNKNILGENASLLFEKGYITKGSLLNITVEELREDAGIKGPLARELCNKLKDDLIVMAPDPKLANGEKC